MKLLGLLFAVLLSLVLLLRFYPSDGEADGPEGGEVEQGGEAVVYAPDRDGEAAGGSEASEELPPEGRFLSTPDPVVPEPEPAYEQPSGDFVAGGTVAPSEPVPASTGSMHRVSNTSSAAAMARTATE